MQSISGSCKATCTSLLRGIFGDAYEDVFAKNVLTKKSSSASLLIRSLKCVIVALCWDISVSCLLEDCRCKQMESDPRSFFRDDSRSQGG